MYSNHEFHCESAFVSAANLIYVDCNGFNAFAVNFTSEKYSARNLMDE